MFNSKVSLMDLKEHENEFICVSDIINRSRYIIEESEKDLEESYNKMKDNLESKDRSIVFDYMNKKRGFEQIKMFYNHLVADLILDILNSNKDESGK